jgi:ribose/xylose/arabinose/galactoside ABC-type transport system permease subunit
MTLFDGEKLKMKSYITQWKDGFILLVKISVLFYAFRILIIMAIFSVAMLLALLGGESDIVVYSIVALLAVILFPPLTTIAAEYLKITKEKPNKFEHDFSK